MKEYKVNFLSNKEYDRLPFQHAKESQGCADQKNRIAYIRKSGIPIVDQFVTAHEIEELVNKNSNHEDTDGIRYKTSSATGNIWKDFTSLFTGKGASQSSGTNYDSSMGGGYSQAAGTGGGGAAQGGEVTGSLGASTTPTNTSTINQPSTTSGLTDAFNNYQSNQLGFANSPVSLGGKTSNIGTTGSNLSTINANPASQNSWSSPNSIAKMFTSSQATDKSLGSNVSLGNQDYNVTGGNNGLTAVPTTNTATASNLGFETPSTITPTSSSTKANVPLQTINQAAVSPSLQTGGEVSSNKQNKPTTKTPILESLFGKDWKQTILGQGIKTLAGAGISAIGQATAEETQVANPTDSALYQQVVERVQSGTQVELTPAQRDAITFNYDQQLDNARKNITQRFKALRPGSDIANDSQLQQALIELENDFAEQKAAAITAAQLGLTQQQTQQLSELATADINYLSQVAGVSNQEAADFKAMMASLGAMVATGGQQRVYS